MTLTTSIALIAAIGLLAASPGPGVFAVVAQSLTHGFRKALALVGGIVLGDLAFLLFAIYGLAWIAEILGAVFEWIRVVGGLYLIGFGINLLRDSGVNRTGNDDSCGKSWSASFLSGLAITLGNPKVIIFYLSLLPTLLNLNSLSAIDVFLVATVVSVTLAFVLSSYALIAARTRQLVMQEHRTKKVKQTAGWMMIGAGATILAKSD